MTTYNKIFVPATIYVAVLFHIVLLFRQMRIASPEELQEPEPPASIELPPGSENSAIEVVEEVEEVEVPPPGDPINTEESSEETGPPYPRQSSAADSTKPSSVPVTPAPVEKVFLPFYRVEKRPTFLYQAPLEYPVQAKMQRIEGVVIVEVDIGENGVIVDTRVIEERGFGLEEAAVEMLKKSRFSPAIIDDRPVAVRMRFTVEFKLR